MNIYFDSSKSGWKGYSNLIIKLCKEFNYTKICDIGGGANPYFSPDLIKEHNFAYHILDISETELAKAPSFYKNKIHMDITSPAINHNHQYQLMFSKMLAEHIEDAEKFHKNIYKLLDNGGISVHFFPTLYSFPFFINKIFPEKMTTYLLDIFTPRDKIQNAKFPAYYNWCRGPTNKQIKKFRNLGFKVLSYYGYFGHDNYYKKIPFIKKLHNIKSGFLIANPVPMFTSYSIVVLQKP